ncbi:MAG: hypothetical protein ABL983_09885 [Nitrospira sp.]
MSQKHQHMLRICREALAGNRGILSTGEHLLAALILNRPDWLHEMKSTIAEAIDRVGLDWIALFPDVLTTLKKEGIDLQPISDENQLANGETESRRTTQRKGTNEER